jgi:hypothetical protein
MILDIVPLLKIAGAVTQENHQFRLSCQGSLTVMSGQTRVMLEWVDTVSD